MPYAHLGFEGFESEDELRVAATDAIVEGHYALHADLFDSEQSLTPVVVLDPITAAQHEAAEAAAELNLLPREQRTPALIAKADRLSVWAAFLASNENVSLVRRDFEFDA